MNGLVEMLDVEVLYYIKIVLAVLGVAIILRIFHWLIS